MIPMILPILLTVAHVIQGNAINANLTGFGGAYAYINLASGGLVSWFLFGGLFLVFLVVAILAGQEVDASVMTVGIVFVIITTVATGVTIAGEPLASSFMPFLFGGIAIVGFMLVAFRGATKSYG